MNDKVQSLIDGTLSQEDCKALNELLRTDAAARAEYAQQMKIHALLTWRTGAVSAAVPKVRPTVWRSTWQWAGWAAAALLFIGFTLFLLSPKPAAAAVSQIIAAWEQAKDRSYTIRVLAGDPWQPLKDGHSVSYEGAKLHLRGLSEFVLVRALNHGGQVITGSDVQTNWDIRGKGPVRVSHETSRFRGGIPGEYQNLPFMDLRNLFRSLAMDYDLTIRDDSADPTLRCLIAHKRNHDKRGLPRMEFQFRQDTGMVVEMELHGLPEEKGGPRAVSLELTSETVFPGDFFTHQAHHEPDREVINESADIKP
ncbi:MAG: hypothetical protein ACKO8Z_00990 [Prosthecobacter sp.]